MSQFHRTKTSFDKWRMPQCISEKCPLIVKRFKQSFDVISDSFEFFATLFQMQSSSAKQAGEEKQAIRKHPKRRRIARPTKKIQIIITAICVRWIAHKCTHMCTHSLLALRVIEFAKHSSMYWVIKIGLEFQICKAFCESNWLERNAKATQSAQHFVCNAKSEIMTKWTAHTKNS